MENKVYTQAELEQEGILTSEYHLNLEPGEFLARLDLKAETRRMLRVFFTFEDGRKVMSTVHWWNRYLGFYELSIGINLRLTFTENSRGEVYLMAAKEA